jgi:tetratricopeptide (TPR) repeat protein
LWLAGAWFGLAVLCEYPAAVSALLAGLYLLSFERRLARLAAFVLLGAALPLAVIAGFNTAAFGHPFQFGYALEKDAYYYAQMNRGFMGFGLPRWSNLWLLTLSPNKGLFFWSPVLALGVAGVFGLARAHRREAAWLGATVLAYVALFSGYFEASGGAGLGPRHLMPLVGPLVLLGACFAGPRGAWVRGAFVGLATASGLLAWAGVFSDPQMQDRLTNPLWDFAVPMLREGVGPGNLLGLADGVASLVALALVIALWAVLWRAACRSGDGRRTCLAAGTALVIALAFYLAIAPQLPRTEPGLRHQVYGNHFVLREDYARAVAEYEQAFALRRDPWILYYQARAYWQLGDTAAAERSAARWRAMLTPAVDQPTGPNHGPPTIAAPPATD